MSSVTGSEHEPAVIDTVPPMRIQPSTVLVRTDSVLANELDGEVVMLAIESGKYFGFDATGSAVWELLHEPRSLEQLCTTLTERFDVDTETCRRDVGLFVEQLVADGTVRVIT